MNLVSMLLVIAAATLLIVAGLVSLIQDLLGRGPHDAPAMDDQGGGAPSNFDLPRDLDHVRGWQVEAVHQFDRVAIEEGEQGEPPTRK